MYLYEDSAGEENVPAGGELSVAATNVLIEIKVIVMIIIVIIIIVIIIINTYNFYSMPRIAQDVHYIGTQIELSKGGDP